MPAQMRRSRRPEPAITGIFEAAHSGPPLASVKRANRRTCFLADLSSITAVTTAPASAATGTHTSGASGSVFDAVFAALLAGTKSTATPGSAAANTQSVPLANIMALLQGKPVAADASKAGAASNTLQADAAAASALQAAVNQANTPASAADDAASEPQPASGDEPEAAERAAPKKPANTASAQSSPQTGAPMAPPVPIDPAVAQLQAVADQPTATANSTPPSSLDETPAKDAKSNGKNDDTSQKPAAPPASVLPDAVAAFLLARANPAQVPNQTADPSQPVAAAAGTGGDAKPATNQPAATVNSTPPSSLDESPAKDAKSTGKNDDTLQNPAAPHASAVQDAVAAFLLAPVESAQAPNQAADSGQTIATAAGVGGNAKPAANQKPDKSAPNLTSAKGESSVSGQTFAPDQAGARDKSAAQTDRASGLPSAPDATRTAADDKPATTVNFRPDAAPIAAATPHSVPAATTPGSSATPAQAAPVPAAAAAAGIDAGKIAAQVQVAPQQPSHDGVSTLDKLGVAIATKSVGGVRQFDIRLDPPELGRVQVHLSVDDSGRAQANLVVDKQQTLDLLQRDSSTLNRALTDAGLDLSNNGLNFSLREQYRQNDNGGVDKGRSRSLSATAAVQANASQIHSSLSYAPNSVRLDIRV